MLYRQSVEGSIPPNRTKRENWEDGPHRFSAELGLVREGHRPFPAKKESPPKIPKLLRVTRGRREKGTGGTRRRLQFAGTLKGTGRPLEDWKSPPKTATDQKCIFHRRSLGVNSEGKGEGFRIQGAGCRRNPSISKRSGQRQQLERKLKRSPYVCRGTEKSSSQGEGELRST